MSRVVAKNQLIKHSIYYQWTELNNTSDKKPTYQTKNLLKCSMNKILIFMLLSLNWRGKRIEEMTLFQSDVLTNIAD